MRVRSVAPNQFFAPIAVISGWPPTLDIVLLDASRLIWIKGVERDVLDGHHADA
jgi:hypothetical protein